MIKNISDEFKKHVRKHMQDYEQKVDIIFYSSSGSVIETKHMSKTELMDNGISFSTGTSSSDSFDIGAAVMGSASVSVSNETDWLSKYDFTNAQLIPYVGYTLSDGTTEYIKKGVYNMENPTIKGTVITLECLDNMSKFEKKLSDVGLVYPIAMGYALQKICDKCGVILKSSIFTNSTLQLQDPKDSNITCLDAIGYIAQMACCYAICDTDGKLVLQWYDVTGISDVGLDGGELSDDTSGDHVDGGNFTNYTRGFDVDGGNYGNFINYHHFYFLSGSPTVYTEQTIITGCEVNYKVDDVDKSVSKGSTWYKLSISNNPFIITDVIATNTLNAIYDKAVGISFRKASFTAIYDPTVEVGDVGYLSDHTGKSYPIILTNISENVNGVMNITSDSKTVSEMKRTGKVSTANKAMAAVKTEKTERETAIRQLAQELSTSSGLHMTSVKQSDGSYIYYMHNKPTLSQSAIVWKLTANAFGISTDGGQTYPYGIDVTGNAILNRIYAIGIIADYIKAGTIEGAIIAKNFTMKGGKIDIETDSETEDKIIFSYNGIKIKIEAGMVEMSSTNGWKSRHTRASSYYEYTSSLDGSVSKARFGSNGMTLGNTTLTEYQLQRLLALI